MERTISKRNMDFFAWPTVEGLSSLLGRRDSPESYKYPWVNVICRREKRGRSCWPIALKIGEHQIVQSHTIFRSMVPKYADKPILVVGGIGDNCRQIAEAWVSQSHTRTLFSLDAMTLNSALTMTVLVMTLDDRYGFKHAYIPADILRWRPSVWPYHKLTEEEMAYSRVSNSLLFLSLSFLTHTHTHTHRKVEIPSRGIGCRLFNDPFRCRFNLSWFSRLGQRRSVNLWSR